jgi:hypothetical protein
MQTGGYKHTVAREPMSNSDRMLQRGVVGRYPGNATPIPETVFRRNGHLLNGDRTREGTPKLPKLPETFKPGKSFPFPCAPHPPHAESCFPFQSSRHLWLQRRALTCYLVQSKLFALISRSFPSHISSSRTPSSGRALVVVGCYCGRKPGEEH